MQIPSRKSILLLALFASLLALPKLSGQTIAVEGTVRDPSGAVIVSASVLLRSGSYQSASTTDARGHFAFPTVPASAGSVEIGSQGFSTVRRLWHAGTTATFSLDVVLQPASASEQVAVSAARTGVRLSETPGSTVLLTGNDVTATPAVRVDDVLRQVPGFSLYRRSDSRTANASNQGVSLRGLGGTASSRALVLEDGLPLVDAFGGWVYWDRVPRASLSSVEVFRGGASNLYGSDALGGVVQFLTRQPEHPAFSLETSYGNERTPDLSSGAELAPANGICRWPRRCSAQTDTSSFLPGSAGRSTLQQIRKMPLSS
jgi:outer membrane receptor protein involved in Fe transport